MSEQRFVPLLPHLSRSLSALTVMGCRSSKMPASATSEIQIQSFDNTYLNEAPTNLRASVSLRSFGTLKEATARLLEKNQEVVAVILDCKKEIRRNPEIFALVKDYLDKGFHTHALKECLRPARSSRLFLHRALRHFDEHPTIQEDEKTIDELKRFKESCDLFSKEFLQVFQSVHQQRLPMLQELRLKKKKLDKKLKSVKAWKKLSCIVSAVLLILSVAAATVLHPPITAAIFAAFSAIDKLFDSMWNKCQEGIKREEMIVSALEAGTSAGINDMNGIMVVVNMLEDQISSLSENGEFNFSDEESVRARVEEIGKIMELSVKSIEDLVAQADQCRPDIERARTVVYQEAFLVSDQLSG